VFRTHGAKDGGCGDSQESGNAEGCVKERTFAMDLPPNGSMSKVLMDGEDISGMLRAVTVHAAVGEATTVELFPRKGSRAELIARLPEAQIVIAEES
jgi:hypothetical protein